MIPAAGPFFSSCSFVLGQRITALSWAQRTSSVCAVGHSA